MEGHNSPTTGPIKPTQSTQRPTQGPLRLTGPPFGPKEDPLRLTEDHRAQAILIDKWLSQTGKGLTQAILIKYAPKVDKGVNT